MTEAQEKALAEANLTVKDGHWVDRRTGERVACLNCEKTTAHEDC